MDNPFDGLELTTELHRSSSEAVTLDIKSNFGFFLRAERYSQIHLNTFGEDPHERLWGGTLCPACETFPYLSETGLRCSGCREPVDHYFECANDGVEIPIPILVGLLAGFMDPLRASLVALALQPMIANWLSADLEGWFCIPGFIPVAQAHSHLIQEVTHG